MKEKTSTPNTKALAEIIDQLTHDIANSTDGSVIIDQSEAQQIVDAGIWLCNFLNDRKVYHKKQQFKRRMIAKLVEEKLSKDELEALDKRASHLAETEALPEGEVTGDEN